MPATTAKSSVTTELIAAIFLLALIAAGCSSPSSAPVALSDLSVPEELQWDGRTWLRESLSSQDQQLLERYFQQHPQVADNPLLQGKQTLYVDDRGHRRFCWVYPVQRQRNWMYLEFDARLRYVGTDEGMQEPFNTD